MGESNLNYLASVDSKKFTVRINMDPHFPNKSKKEYDALRAIEQPGIAPKVFHVETSRKWLGETFIILEYLKGKSLAECEKIREETLRELGKGGCAAAQYTRGRYQEPNTKNRVIQDRHSEQH